MLWPTDANRDYMSPKISIVVPAYNEALALPVLIRDISRNLLNLYRDFEIIVIDDGSTDNTWIVLEKCLNECKQLRGFHFTRNFGKESAIYAGLKLSTGDAVVVIDADMQHPVGLLPEMIGTWETSGVHIVEAVKEKRQKESPIRAWGSYLFYRVFSKSTGIDLENSSDYKLLDRKMVDQYLALPENIRFFRALTKWLGYSSHLLYYTPSDRFGEKKTSQWTVRKLFDFARNSLLSFTSFPLRIVTWLGVTTFFVSIILGIQTLWMKLSGSAVEGFTTVILVDLGIGSVIMLSLGLIGEYLARIYEEIKHRPIYVIDKQLKD
jgi:polyisoprenyl-phosphate glycosyltransferase